MSREEYLSPWINPREVKPVKHGYYICYCADFPEEPLVYKWDGMYFTYFVDSEHGHTVVNDVIWCKYIEPNPFQINKIRNPEKISFNFENKTDMKDFLKWLKKQKSEWLKSDVIIHEIEEIDGEIFFNKLVSG